MSDILTQDEIDNLLLDISSGEVNVDSEWKEGKEVKFYDFRHPERFLPSHLRLLKMIHEDFARILCTAYAFRLRTNVSTHLLSIDQLTCGEFIRNVNNPTTIAVIDLGISDGSALFEIDRSITFAIIDKLFGGLGETSRIERELTEIEHAVMKKVITGMINNLQQAWSKVIDVKPFLKEIETNSRFVQIIPDGEMVVLVKLEMNIGEVMGMINICIPYSTLESMPEKFFIRKINTAHVPEPDENISIVINRTKYKQYVMYSDAIDQMTLDEIGKLKPGSRIFLSDDSTGTISYKYVENR